MDDERSRGLLDPKSKLMFRIQAETYEEALAVKNVKLGWSPYFPNGEPAFCPNGCGGVFYPAGFHECPNCGLISPEQCRQSLDAQEAREEGDAAEIGPVRAMIKFVENADTPSLSVSAYFPEDPSDFRCTIGLTIGPATGDGGEQFYLTVCSLKWLAKACEKSGFLWGRHHLIVPEYNLKTIMSVVTKFVDRCSGESWKEVAEKLSRFTSWEFEDYRKDS
jgi:hypothetical protein